MPHKRKSKKTQRQFGILSEMAGQNEGQERPERPTPVRVSGETEARPSTIRYMQVKWQLQCRDTMDKSYSARDTARATLMERLLRIVEAELGDFTYMLKAKPSLEYNSISKTIKLRFTRGDETVLMFSADTGQDFQQLETRWPTSVSVLLDDNTRLLCRCFVEAEHQLEKDLAWCLTTAKDDLEKRDRDIFQGIVKDIFKDIDS